MWKIAMLAALFMGACAAHAASDPQLAEYERKLAEWQRAQDAYKPRADAYWTRMRAARARGEYLDDHPPVYDGPAKPAHPYREPQTLTIPTKEVFLAAAQRTYGFVPEAGTEYQFKLNYAREALAAGLTAEQVAGVYAFETGGNGRHDLQPIGRNGPISTALGYAQLLNANSVQMTAWYGAIFAAELDSAGKREKADALRRMARDARAVADGWEAAQAYAKTEKGRAMHALNLDVDIGPKMQMQKLRTIALIARDAGHASLSPAELELLNLAGEANGLLMLRPELKAKPTANFFARDGYEANPVVHKRTAEGLLNRIDELMARWSVRDGVVEFREAFRAVQQ